MSRDPECGYGDHRPLDEQEVLEAWRMARHIRRPLTSLEIAVALQDGLPEALDRPHNQPRK